MRPLLLAPVILAALAAQEGAKSVAFPNGTVEARGGCEARPEGVSCWDMDGKPSPELTDGLRALLNNGNEVSFKVGKKNRYVVTRRPQAFPPQYRMGKDTYLNPTSTYSGDPVTDYIRVAVEPSATTAAILVQTTVQNPNEVDLPFREGTATELEGRKFELGPASKIVPEKDRPAVNPYNNQPITGLTWGVAMSVTGGDPNGTYWSYVPLDAQGVPILYVDAAGKPITPLKAISLEPNIQNNNGYYYPNNGTPPPKKPKASVAFFNGGGNGAFRATTNVDPKAIAKLRVKSSHQESRELGPFPLDPAK